MPCARSRRPPPTRRWTHRGSRSAAPARAERCRLRPPRCYPDVVRLCHADVPFMCDIERALTQANKHPYLELVAFLHQHPDLVKPARHTLRHVDCALLATRIRARCLLSVGLMDEICPPSTVYAAYNAISAPKQLAVTSTATTTSAPPTTSCCWPTSRPRWRSARSEGRARSSCAGPARCPSRRRGSRSR